MTATLLYLHGFLSSPKSHKARLVHDWLARQRPDIRYLCPQLTPYPARVAAQLERLAAGCPGPLYLMGSSLGGFWATWLAERHGLRALLINPSVQPSRLLPPFLHQELGNYHTDDSYRLTDKDLADLEHAEREIAWLRRPDNYWLLVQTGDETLDYREAVARYAGSAQTLEAGGDHAFQGFERFLPPALAFFETGTAQAPESAI